MKQFDAVIKRDKYFDGKFYYGVTTTGIFCKPSCNSKDPLEKNTVFFDSKEDAQKQGYRPCKRCRPDLIEFTPLKDIVREVKEHIDNTLSIKGLNVGLSTTRVRELFKNEYGITMKQYELDTRINKAKELLSNNASILDIVESLHYKSTSGFYAFFKRNTGMTPVEFRKESLK